VKLRITITGPKVHDVDYRYLLLGGAMGLRIPGFYATNLVELEKQMVEVLVEGKKPQVRAFMEFVQNNKPANARVSDITKSEYEEDVPRRSEYTQDITALQMLKAIPTILRIEESVKPIPQMAKNTDMIPPMAKNTEKILEEVKGLRDEIQPGLGEQLRQMQADIRALKDRTGML
jgi:acylphosphatase